MSILLVSRYGVVERKDHVESVVEEMKKKGKIDSRKNKPKLNGIKSNTK